MNILRLTEKPSGNQVWVNMDNVKYFSQLTNDHGLCTKLEFDEYNLLVHEAPDQLVEMINE